MTIGSEADPFVPELFQDYGEGYDLTYYLLYARDPPTFRGLTPSGFDFFILLSRHSHAIYDGIEHIIHHGD